MEEGLRRAVIKRTIAFRNSCFNAFATDLFVRCATGIEYELLPKRERSKLECCAYFSFISRTEDGRSCLTLPVRVVRRCKTEPFNYEKIEIQWRGEWRLFEEAFTAILSVSPFAAPIGDAGYRALWKWYRHRGQPFRFMDLPKEIRLIVYEVSVGPNIYPNPYVIDAARLLGRGWVPPSPKNGILSWELKDKCFEGTHDPKDEVPSPRIWLGINKTIQEEVADTLWNSSMVWAPNIFTLRDLVQIPRMTTRSPTILGLNFTHLGYFDFFGGPLLLGLSPTPLASCLLDSAHLPHLRQLVIKFQSTCWMPVQDRYLIRDFEAVTQSKNQEREICQKTVTELILTYAFKHIRHIPEVEVEGYIKASTKSAFRRAMEERSQDPSQEVPQSWRKRIGDLSRFNRLVNMDTQPYECHCTKPCGFYGSLQINDKPPSKSLRELFATKYHWDDQD